jgi:four helix bundle suffix protein
VINLSAHTVALTIKWSKLHDQAYKILQKAVKHRVPLKKTELKLTNVSRASLEELCLDYEDFLRQRNLPKWNYNDPRRKDLISQRITTAHQFALWAKKVNQENKGTIEEIAANGVLVLLAVINALLDRQIAAQAEAFKQEGGFTERLYHFRKNAK